MALAPVLPHRPRGVRLRANRKMMYAQKAVGSSAPTPSVHNQAVENAYQDSGSSPPFDTSAKSVLAPMVYSHDRGAINTLDQVASDQRRKGRKSMSRRSGQKGQVVKKGGMWHVRFYVDVAGQEKRQRKSVPIGPCIGKDKLTKPEAVRKGTEVIASLGVNTAEHLAKATNSSSIVTFGQRVEWCRKYHKAWTESEFRAKHGEPTHQAHSSTVRFLTLGRD